MFTSSITTLPNRYGDRDGYLVAINNKPHMIFDDLAKAQNCQLEAFKESEGYYWEPCANLVL